MTTTATNWKTDAVASGVAPIPFDFQALSEDEVGVLRNGAEQVGGFTVALNGDGTGSVTPTSTWGTDSVTVYSKPTYEQLANFTRFGAFYPDQFNPPLDRLARSVIAVRGEIDTALANSLSIEGMSTAPTRAAVKLIPNPTDGQAVVLSEKGYGGLFFWRLGDFSANVTSDPSEEFYLVSDTIPATVGAWVRELRDLPQPLATPAGFDWYPPVNIYRSPDGTFTTNFNGDQWKVPATASIYISQAGSDTTGNGTAASPWRTVAKAQAQAALLADENINIFMAAGEYVSNSGNLPADKNINMIATGGRALITNKNPRGPWTLDGAGTYRAGLLGYTAGGGVRDWKFPVTQPNGETTPQFLTLAASKADCQATPSTYYTDGVNVWVHRQDGSVVDDATGADVGVIHQTNNTLITYSNKNYYFEKVDFEGSSLNAQPGTGSTIKQVVVNDSRFYFGSYTFLGTELVILNKVRAFETIQGDLFAYSPRDVGAVSTKAIEIDCVGITTRTAGPNDNGSTNHGDGRTVRVNCFYRNTSGPVCIDVGTCQNWNLNVDAQDCLLTSNDENDASFVCGNSSSTACRTWLDGCTTGGAFYDFYVGPGCELRYRNMLLPPSIGGAGSVAPY